MPTWICSFIPCHFSQFLWKLLFFLIAILTLPKSEATCHTVKRCSACGICRSLPSRRKVAKQGPKWRTNRISGSGPKLVYRTVHQQTIDTVWFVDLGVSWWPRMAFPSSCITVPVVTWMIAWVVDTVMPVMVKWSLAERRSGYKFSVHLTMAGKNNFPKTNITNVFTFFLLLD